MLSELGLVGDPRFRATFLQFESPFVYLEAHEKLLLICLTLHVREDVKKHDIIHIKPKSYKLELLGELIV